MENKCNECGEEFDMPDMNLKRQEASVCPFCWSEDWDTNIEADELNNE